MEPGSDLDELLPLQLLALGMKYEAVTALAESCHQYLMGYYDVESDSESEPDPAPDQRSDRILDRGPGWDPDPNQPPVDPAGQIRAVLARLLGVSADDSAPETGLQPGHIDPTV
jgi:hypothetical protein